MGKQSEKYYQWKLKEEKEEIYRVSAKYLELIILYTSLLFIVLAQWYRFESVYKLSTVEFFIISILLFSSILSTFSLLFAFLSNFLMRLTKAITKIPEEFFHRISVGYFFFSVVFLLVFLSSLAEIRFFHYLPFVIDISENLFTSFRDISIIIVLWIPVYMYIMHLIEKNKGKIKNFLRKLKQDFSTKLKDYFKTTTVFIIALLFYMAVFHEIMHLIPCFFAGFDGSIERLIPFSEVLCSGIENSNLPTQFIYIIFPYLVDTLLIFISLILYKRRVSLPLSMIGLFNTLGNFFSSPSDFTQIVFRYGLNFYLLSTLIAILNSFLFFLVLKRKTLIPSLQPS
jgi:hypothetical protein